MELFNEKYYSCDGIWQWQKGEIPDEICDYIINNIEDTSYEKGTTININKEFLRNVNIQSNNINWINALLCGYIRYANSLNFHYNLSDEDKELAQISKYSLGEFYGEHRDFGTNDDSRKEVHRLMNSCKVVCSNCWIKLDNDLIEFL